MKTFMVYGISDCPACLRACADLMEKQCEYVFVETDFSRSYRQHLKDRYSHSTFPIITILTGAHPQTEWIVGGYDSLVEHLFKECNIEKAI